MDKKAHQKTFNVSDIWIASALSLILKAEPELIIDNDKIIFGFPFSAETIKALNDLGSGAVRFDYLTYSEKVKSLKGKMMNLKRLKAGLQPA